MSAIRNELEYINRTAAENPLDFVAASEMRFKNIISSIAERSLKARGHKLILLAGPSASGKTTTAGKIAEALGKGGVDTFRISMDDYYLPAEKLPLQADGSRDYESIHALDIPLLRDNLRELMETGCADLPIFNFKTGKREPGRRICLDEEDMIVLEGLHAINPLLSEGLGWTGERVTKIYISVSSRIYGPRQEIICTKRAMRLARRILRDAQFRNAPAEETLSMWESVTKGEDHYLTPCKPNADLLINSVHIYEPCVFRDKVLPLVDAVSRDHPAYQEAAKLAKGLRRFLPLDSALVPKDSLLREFLGEL
ncbi:MAG: hypothetical protein LBR73_06500 [Oscillospiraceae bacterium]|nr:hypothetical protein [Oscillospiraceae bacterium]